MLIFLNNFIAVGLLTLSQRFDGVQQTQEVTREVLKVGINFWAVIAGFFAILAFVFLKPLSKGNGFTN